MAQNFALGMCYKNGTGVAIDLKTALYWFELAGNQRIRDLLSSMLAYGMRWEKGTAQNFRISTEVYLKTIEQRVL